MNRNFVVIISLLGISAAISWFMTGKGGLGPKGGSGCLAHADCRSDERCVVIPKGDGFATYGTCGAPCIEDAACPNGWKCFSLVDEKGFLSPEAGRPEAMPRVKACAYPSMGKKE